MIRLAALPIKPLLAVLVLTLLVAVGFQVRGNRVKETTGHEQLAVAEAVIPPPAAPSPCRATRSSFPLRRASLRSPSGYASRR